MGVSTKVGPQNGSLVIIGGTMEPEAIQRFIELSGGPHASLVLIPTASGDNRYGPAQQGRLFKPFTELGATRLRILHTRDREEANSDAFVQTIREAQGVFFGGGRQWHLADAYLGTKTEEALRDLLDRGGCIAGSSAGATIQGSYLVRGDTRGNMILMGDHEQGFGFLKNVAIDQHLLKRNRHMDLIEVIRQKPELLGIGIDEGAAIVVRGDRFEVVGRSYVAIYDAGRMGERGCFYFLAPGDEFDLVSRATKRRTNAAEELWLPQFYDRMPIPAERLEPYTGSYQSPEFRIEISICGDRIFSEQFGQSPVELVPVSAHVFFEAGWGKKVTFNLNPDGGVEGFTVEAAGSKTVFSRVR